MSDQVSFIINVDTLSLKRSCSGCDPYQTNSMEISLNRNDETHSASDKQYICSEFGSKVLQNLNSLRQNSRFCDVEIHACGEVIKAHRAVLSASSPYFRAMFNTGLLEEQSQTVELHAVDGNILQSLIDFIYTGTININKENVQGLLIAADMLELTDVISSCTHFLKQELHLTNAIGIYRFAEAHSCQALANVALNFIHCHFPAVSKEEEFNELPKDQLIKFISSEHLQIDTELEVLQAAIGWILHDVSQRRQFVFEILAQIRLPFVPTCLLDRTISDCSDESLKVALRSVRKDLVTGKLSFTPSSISPRLNAKTYIFVIGGCKYMEFTNRLHIPPTESVERFDTIRKEWCHVSPMTIARSWPGVALLNGLIYVVGGEQESQILANGECYNPHTDTWNKVACMVEPRCEFGFCAVDDNLYALGGCIGQDIGSTIEKYDPTLDEWRLDGYLPEPRYGMGAVSHEGLIYIVGGCTDSGHYRRDLLSYNPVTREWNRLPSMQVSRIQMGVAVLNGFLYVVGGTCHGNETTIVERYSFEENQWSRVPCMKIELLKPTVAAAGGLLYVMGGRQSCKGYPYRGAVSVSFVECYNPVTEEWINCPPLLEDRSNAVAVVA